MNSASDLILLARVAGSLVVVLVVVALAARMARRAKFGRSVTGIRVLERTGLTRDASVAVVEVADRALVLGVTPHGVSLLTVLDGDRLAPDEPEDTAPRRGRSRLGRRPAAAAPPASRSATSGREAGSAGPGPSPADAFAAALADAGADGGLPSTFPPEGIPLPGGDRLSAEDFGRIVEEAGQRLFGGARPTDRDAGVLPSGIRLDQYPDLASALRAAGRVQQPAQDAPRPSAGSPSAGISSAARPSTGRPQGARPSAAQPAVPRQATRPAAAEGRPAPAKGSARSADRRQASGSVLDPATWRQGIEALRDLTARKG